MSDKHTVMEQIHAAFQALEFPGEGFLQGSFEGTEPYDEEGPFRGQTNWQPWFVSRTVRVDNLLRKANNRIIGCFVSTTEP